MVTLHLVKKKRHSLLLDLTRFFFLLKGLITWVAMANNQPYYGYINNDVTLIAVPAGLGILGAIIYALFWSISIYLIGSMGGFALALYILCCKENLVITQVNIIHIIKLLSDLAY